MVTQTMTMDAQAATLDLDAIEVVEAPALGGMLAGVVLGSLMWLSGIGVYLLLG